MKYYALIKDTEIIGTCNCPCQSEDCVCIEIIKEQYDLLQEKGNNYLIYENDKITLNTNYEQEQLEKAKQDKLKLLLVKANEYINEIATYCDIECTDGNISKLTAYLIAMQQGLRKEIAWVTKSDTVIILTIEDIMDILENIGNIQTKVWTCKYVGYKEQIEQAETLEELEAIVIDYSE